MHVAWRANRRIAFFWDNLLLSTFVVLTHRLKGAGHGMPEPRADDFYTPGGQLHLRVI